MVARVRGIGFIPGQEFVETTLGIVWQDIGQIDLQPAEARRPDRDQQGGHRFALLAQVSDAFFDQIFSGKAEFMFPDYFAPSTLVEGAALAVAGLVVCEGKSFCASTMKG